MRMRCAELAASSKEPPEKWLAVAAAIYEFASGEKADAATAKLALVREVIS